MDSEDKKLENKAWYDKILDYTGNTSDTIGKAIKENDKSLIVGGGVIAAAAGVEIGAATGATGFGDTSGVAAVFVADLTGVGADSVFVGSGFDSFLTSAFGVDAGCAAGAGAGATVGAGVVVLTVAAGVACGVVCAGGAVCCPDVGASTSASGAGAW